MPSSSDLPLGAVRASGLGRRFELRDASARSLREVLIRRSLPKKRELWALRDVDLEVAPGETFGIVGQNGSGKSTLLKLLAGIFAPSEGTISSNGRVGSLLEVGAGFHPEFTGIENVYLNAAVFGISRDYVDAHLDEIIAFAELEEFAGMPVKTYSSGMFTRLGFSVAMHVQPDILLLDEVLAVGDEAFQQKCLGKIWDFKRSGGTMVFVSHDPGAVERLCDRAILLERGRVVAEGTAEDVLRAYHRRLADRAAPAEVRIAAGKTGPIELVDLRTVAGDLVIRTRFVEGEPICFDATLLAPEGADGLAFSLGIRDASGHAIGVRTATGVALRPGIPESVRFHVDSLPLREGRFFIDIRVTSHDGDAILVDAERALEISVFAHEPGGGGPVRIPGAFELPRVPEPSAPSVTP